MLQEHLDSQDKTNNFDDSTYSFIVQLANELDLYTSVRTPNRIDVGDHTQRDFYLVFELDSSELVMVYFVFKTDSLSYDGERTDLHDCQSILFSICCSTNAVSVSLWDIDNGFSDIEGELYGRFAMVSQPNLSAITQDKVGQKNIESIFAIYKDYQSFVLPYKCQSSNNKGYEWDTEYIYLNRQSIASVLNVDIQEVVGNKRTQPDWDYFQVYSKRISIIRSSLAETMLGPHIESTYKEISQLDDDNCKYYKLGILKNSFSNSDVKNLTKLALKITGSSPTILASESHLFAISNDWIFSKQGEYGFERFKSEREKFSKLISEKVDFLYERPSLVWNESGSPSRFEDLCRELLSREPLVSRVRKVAPTNQPDRSRDLIAEIIDYKPTDELVNELDQPAKIDKFLVQCKMSKKTLGIPKSMGPFEALYLGDYDGYFLITNTALSSDHTGLLEKIRSDKRYTADWWTRDEVELRLQSNFDLIHEYPDLVGYQNLTS
jgi:hypothetical protein